MNIASVRYKEDPMDLKIQINFSHFYQQVLCELQQSYKHNCTKFNRKSININIASVRNMDDPMDLKIQIN